VVYCGGVDNESDDTVKGQQIFIVRSCEVERVVLLVAVIKVSDACTYSK